MGTKKIEMAFPVLTNQLDSRETETSTVYLTAL